MGTVDDGRRLRPRTGREDRALELMVYLEHNGGRTAAEALRDLKWTRSQFDAALRTVRDDLGPKMGVTIPHPVPDDGFRYRVTGAWLHEDGTPAIEAGTAYAMAIIETRLRAVLRDVRIAKMNMDRRSVNGRKANFLDKHLTHIVGVLGEIGPVPGLPDDKDTL